MELVTILRTLWRRRILVALVAALAILAGAAVAYRLPSLESRKTEVGVATTRILVDTPNSQVVEVAPKGSDTLGVRANLIANLMAEGVVKAAIAERAGLRSDQLRGVAVSDAAVPVDASGGATGDYVLTTRVPTTTTGNQLPIIEVEARAPTTVGAAKLAGAAVKGLADYLDSKAATEKVKNAQRLRVTGLGAAQARTVTGGPGAVFAVMAFFFVFLVGCGAIVVVSTLVSGWRAVSEEEYLNDLLDDDGDPLPKPEDDGQLADPWDDWPDRDHAVAPRG